MDFRKEKQMWFRTEEISKIEAFLEKNDATHYDKQLPMYKQSTPLWKSEGGNRSKVPQTCWVYKVFPEGQQPVKRTVLDPGSDIVLKWNGIFLFSCLVALFVNPLFFCLPSVLNQRNSSCMESDLNLRIVVTVFRTLADVFYVLHVIVKFRRAYVAPSSRVFGKGELVMDKIAMRYLKSDFVVDLIAALPLPQIVVWSILPASWCSTSLDCISYSR